VNARTTIVLLICGAGLIAGAGAGVWLFGDHLLLFQSASASLSPDDPAFEARYPVANTDLKQDRDLTAIPIPAPAAPVLPNDMYETAYAWLQAPVTLPRFTTPRAEKPARLFINEMQIAGLRKRLNLTAAQQKYWPPVESALRRVTVQIEDYQKRQKKARDETFDTDSEAVQQLKTAAKALYAQLNGTQKNDLALLARMAGLGPAFAMLTGKAVAKNEPENSR
jgi:hypothetical protein